MFKKLFVVLMVGAFVAGAAEAKLKKVGAPEKGIAVTSASKIASPVVRESGVEFIYHNPQAKSVFVAGTFNDWNSSKDAMSKDSKGVWKITLPLKIGTHQYKFVVDGNWLEDPLNPNKTEDGLGGQNSVVEVKTAPRSAMTAGGPQVTKEGVKFVYKNPAAKSVFVAGDFNNWNQTADPMTKQKDGTWLLVKNLPEGKHAYKFIADGNWLPDPENPNVTDDDFGGHNSVVEVLKAPGVSGTLSAGPKKTKEGVEFIYINPTAGSVFVAGSFNNWNTRANPMTKDKVGRWKAVIPLSPGKYQYKFVVDGRWLEDPSNPNTTDDGYGGKNSVFEFK